MYSQVVYLISGATTSPTTGTFQCLGMDKFTVTMHGTNNGANTATGVLSLSGRIDSAAPYVNIYSNSFAGGGNIVTQFDGPWQSLRANLEGVPTGTFSVVCRYS